MMTFSLSPDRLSPLPWTAASVRIFVVSWKEAAEIQDSVESEALVIPNSCGSAFAGVPFSALIRSFSSLNTVFSTLCPTRKFVSPGSLILTLLSICRTMTSMCLSLIRTPWSLYTSWISSTRKRASSLSPCTRRMSCGLGDPSMRDSPARILSPSCTVMCFPRGMVYSRASPMSGTTWIFRFPLKSLPSRTTPSISEMTANSLGFLASKSSATRGRPPVMSFVFVVSRGIFAMMSPATRFCPSSTKMFDPMGRRYRASLEEPGSLSVRFFSSLIQIRGRPPPPLPPLLPVLHQQGSPIGDGILLPLPVVLVQNDQETVPVHGDVLPIPVLHHGQALELDLSRVFRLDVALLDEPGGRAADVERPHRELGPGLPDRLRRDDADRLPDGHHLPARQIPSVTERADSPLALAGQGGADLDFVHPRHLDLSGHILRDLLVGGDEELPVTVVQVLERHPSQDAVGQPVDDLPAFHEGADGDPVERLTVVLDDDAVLGHVHQPPGEIPGVRRLEGGVGEAFPGSVGGDEVLPDRQPLAEVRGDRRLDDLPRRLGHQSPHPGELAHLLVGSPSARVRHHIDGVEARDFPFLSIARLDRLRSHLAKHFRRDLLGRRGPDVDHLVVPLAVGDESSLVLLHHGLHLGGRLF